MILPGRFNPSDPANLNDWRDFFETAHKRFNRPDFIPDDPVSIPHRYSRKEDIEIAGFLTAIISWGNRASILKNASNLMKLMDDVPADFIFHAKKKDLEKLDHFVHRTFQSTDLLAFVYALQQIYLHDGGLEQSFLHGETMMEKISNFKRIFFSFPHAGRTEKHLPDPLQGSAAKRINMFLRWMVRKDEQGVDFGIWKKISPADLICPLDVHSGRTARKFGLLLRRQDDWKSAMELTSNLRILDPADPVRFDFVLFGLSLQLK